MQKEPIINEYKGVIPWQDRNKHKVKINKPMIN